MEPCKQLLLIKLISMEKQVKHDPFQNRPQPSNTLYISIKRENKKMSYKEMNNLNMIINPRKLNNEHCLTVWQDIF